MTREEAIRIIKIVLTISADFEIIVQGEEMTEEKCKEAVEIVTKALMQEPCDAVSREAVIEGLASIAKVKAKSDAQKAMMGRCMYFVETLPSVTPAEKVGHWEYVQYDGDPNIGNWHCSECNRIVCGAITAVNPVYSYKYCPNCGAKMEEVK